MRNLRHTFATLHLDTNEAGDVVADLLGQSRPSTTMNIYRTRSTQHFRSSATRLEALLITSADGVTGGVTGGGEVGGSGWRRGNVQEQA